MVGSLIYYKIVPLTLFISQKCSQFLYFLLFYKVKSDCFTNFNVTLKYIHLLLIIGYDCGIANKTLANLRIASQRFNLIRLLGFWGLEHSIFFF